MKKLTIPMIIYALLLSVQTVFADEVEIVEEDVVHSFWPWLALGLAVIAAVLLLRIMIKKKKSR